MKKIGLLTILLVLGIVTYFGCQFPGIQTFTFSQPEFRVTFLDVGQADSTLVQCQGVNWLVDGGNNEDGKYVVEVLHEMGVNHLDAVVGTHPHEDHVGGLDVVINNYNVGQVFLSDASSTTHTYEDLLKAIADRSLTISNPDAGTMFKLGAADGLWEGPINSAYDEINDYSLVMRLSYKDWSFLLTGDAGIIPEKEMLAAGYPLGATVLKVGHHGSISSTSDEFLKAVAPKYAVIFLGKDNDYNHPHAETLAKLQAAGVSVLRTDLNGEIIFSAKGTDFEVVTQK